jgi:hypothetical protein
LHSSDLLVLLPDFRFNFRNRLNRLNNPTLRETSHHPAIILGPFQIKPYSILGRFPNDGDDYQIWIKAEPTFQM